MSHRVRGAQFPRLTKPSTHPMRFNKLDLNLLVALDALLTERSITRAAERLHMSQPAMSNAVARLRSYMDDPLVVRVGRKLELTPRAERLKETVRDLLVRIDSTITAPPVFDPARSNRRFTLIVSDYTSQIIMPRVLRQAEQLGSQTSLRMIRLDDTQSSVRLLERGEADLLLIPQPYVSPLHPSEYLMSEDHVALVWRDAAVARCPLDLEAYCEARHVLFQLVGHDEPAYEQWFIDRVGTSRKAGALTYGFGAMPFLVIGTELIATVHRRMAMQLVGVLPLVIRELPFEMPPLELAVQWHAQREDDPGLCWLRQLVQNAADEVKSPAAVTPLKAVA